MSKAVLVLAAAACLARPVAAQALGALTVGGVESHPTLGASLALPLGGPSSAVMLGIGGAVSTDSIRDLSSWTYWEGNVDLVLRTTAQTRLRGFALVGFNLARAAGECPYGGCVVGSPEWDTSAGLNVGAGFALVWPSVAPFLGVKRELRERTPWAVFLGAAFPFPGYD